MTDSPQRVFAGAVPQFTAIVQKLAALYATTGDPTGFVRFSAIVDQLAAGVPDMRKADNLGGLANTDTALANLTAGLGTGGGRAVFKAADAAAVRAVLALGTAAVANTDNDSALAANSALVVATQQAVKTYIDNSVASLLKNRGNLDCSTNPNYPAGTNGDAYYVSVAGKIGGASGKTVEIGDVVVAKATNAGGTEAAVGTSWYVLQANLIGALQAGNNLADVGSVATAFDNLARVASTTFGRNQLTLADAAALTAQVNAFTSTLKGAVPASGGGTTNFLRADGTWAAAGAAATHPGYVSTKAYSIFPNNAGSSFYPQNYLTAVPYVVRSTLNINQLVVKVDSVETGKTFKLAIYANSATGRPGTVLASSAATSLDATGVVSVTMGVSLVPGVYWFAILSDSSTAILSACNLQTRGNATEYISTSVGGLFVLFSNPSFLILRDQGFAYASGFPANPAVAEDTGVAFALAVTIT